MKGHQALPAVKVAPLTRTVRHRPSGVSKKADLLGQDTSKLDEQEFRLQSMVSPELHSDHLTNNFKQMGNLNMETMSPAEISFIQSSTQWHKYSQPRQTGQSAGVHAAGTIFPEDPVPFPGESKNSFRNNQDSLPNLGNENWSEFGHEGASSSRQYKGFGIGSNYDDKESWSVIDKLAQQGENSFNNYAFTDSSPPAKPEYVEPQFAPLKQKPIETIQDSIMFMGKTPRLHNMVSSSNLLGAHPALPLQGSSVVNGDLTGQKANSFIDSLMSDSSISGSIGGLSKAMGASSKVASPPILPSSNFLSKLKTQPMFDAGGNTRSHSVRRKNAGFNRTAPKKKLLKELWIKRHRTQKPHDETGDKRHSVVVFKKSKHEKLN